MTQKRVNRRELTRRLIWAVSGVAAVSACQMMQGLHSGASAPSEPSQSGSEPSAGRTASPQAPAAAPDLPGNIIRVKAASDASPGEYSASKEYALQILQSYEARQARKPSNAAWEKATVEAAERHQGNLKDATLTVPLRSFDLMMIGTLYGFAGKLPEARAALAESFRLQPNSLPALKAALDIEKDAKDVAGNESFCKQARQGLEKQPKAEHEKSFAVLMQLCVEHHPSNADGEVKAASFERFVPWASPKDIKSYRVHLATQECLGESGTCSNRCISTQCHNCDSRPLDAKWTQECKRACKLCRQGCDERERACVAKAKRL